FEILGPVRPSDQRQPPRAPKRLDRLGDVGRDDGHARTGVEEALDLLARDRAGADDDHVPAREVEAGHVVPLLAHSRFRRRQSRRLRSLELRRAYAHASTLVTRTPCRSSRIESCGPSVATASVKEPGPTAVSDSRSIARPSSAASASFTAAALSESSAPVGSFRKARSAACSPPGP